MKLLHLYYDIMNLYGDYANISAVERLFKLLGTDVSTDRKTFKDNVTLSDYDFIYIGSGTEKNRNAVMKDFRRFSDDIKSCIENNKVILMTGNSFEMLGKSVTDSSGRTEDALGIFSFTTTEQNKTRQTGDAIFTMEGTDKKLVGFINKCSCIEGIDTPLFSVEMGMGNTDEDKHEGIRKNNFFGTHLTGPILIKNPYFLCCIASLISGKEITASEKTMAHEIAGYNVTLSELTKRIGN